MSVSYEYTVIVCKKNVARPCFLLQEDPPSLKLGILDFLLWCSGPFDVEQPVSRTVEHNDKGLILFLP